jgi:hypothetical protein
MSYTDDFADIEAADEKAVPAERLLPDPLAFDTDSKRQNEDGVAGIYGGFFLADDCNADAYDVPNAPREPKGWLKRVNGSLPEQQIPGVHTPRRVRFALVAAGPLRRKMKDNGKMTHTWQAIVLCNEIFDKTTGDYALLKLTVNGVVATKLFNYMVTHISKPCDVLTDYFHEQARLQHKAGKINNERLQFILSKRATPQMFWIPVRVEPGQRIGLDPQNSTMGALPVVDRLVKGGRFETLWPQVPKEMLIARDNEMVAIGGREYRGLRLPQCLHEFCRDNREKYERLLIEAAERDQSTIVEDSETESHEAEETFQSRVLRKVS